MKTKGDTNLISEKTMVRLINDDGSSSIISENDAQHIARQKGLDVVVIDDRSDIVTVKILDYGKYQYDISKKRKASQKIQKASQVKLKEIQLRPVTGDNDIKIKAENAKRFLKDNNQVKIVVKFRGREINNMSTGLDILKKFLENVETFKIIQETKVNGKDVFVVIGKSE